MSARMAGDDGNAKGAAMTTEEAKAAVAQYGSQRKAAAALGMSRRVIQRAVERDKRAAGPSDSDTTPADVTPAVGGFTLTGKHLLAQKPTDVWKGRFYALRRGIGYRLEALVKEWGTAMDTIRAKARVHGALRYVEDPEQPGQYIACAVHPDTPIGK